MKIEVKDNSNEKEIKLRDFPLDSEYFGKNGNEDDLKIFILSKTLNQIDGFLSGDMNNELGGVLVGDVCRNREKKNFILINNFITAKHSNSTLSRLTFTHETWDYINEARENDFPSSKILGWFHSHPGHTVFLSNYDLFIQENFFNIDYMVAYVFDPTIKERGFYHWREGKIVKSDGYYVYNADPEDEFKYILPLNTDSDLLKITDSNANTKKNDSFRNIRSIVFLLLTLCILLLMIYNIYDINQKSLLEEQYIKELNEVKNENKKLTERLNKLVTELELKKSVAVDSSNAVIKNNADNPLTIKGSEVNSETSKRKYRVKAGDNLEKIAMKFYNDESAMALIMKQNNIKNKNDIRLGQELELP